MVAALLLLLAANTPGSTSDFANRILSIGERTGARIGVAALDTASGKRLDYRSEERFPMCSTFKFLAAAAVLKRVDDGQEKLDRFIIYGANDILEYAPVTKAHLKDWLRHNETGALMIRAGVPKTWSVGDKTGRCANGATNDVAIIRPPGRGPILVAVYSIGSTSSADDRAATVAEAVRVIVEFLSL